MVAQYAATHFELPTSRTLEQTKAENRETKEEGREGGGQFVGADKDSIGKLLMQMCAASGKTPQPYPQKPHKKD